MMERLKLSPVLRWTLCILLLVAAVAGGWWYLEAQGTWQRGTALSTALLPIVGGNDPEHSLVARVILDNYLETRANASRWSGVYWGFTFTAAAFSALAALILKMESFVRSEGAKKDLAATLSIAAALLVTISTSGDFQRKWQANRIAAAELERIGYEFLENNGADARTYLAAIGQSMLKRQLSIVGSSTQPKEPK